MNVYGEESISQSYRDSSPGLAGLGMVGTDSDTPDPLSLTSIVIRGLEL